MFPEPSRKYPNKSPITVNHCYFLVTLEDDSLYFVINVKVLGILKIPDEYGTDKLKRDQGFIGRPLIHMTWYVVST